MENVFTIISKDDNVVQDFFIGSKQIHSKVQSIRIWLQKIFFENFLKYLYIERYFFISEQMKPIKSNLQEFLTDLKKNLNEFSILCVKFKKKIVIFY